MTTPSQSSDISRDIINAFRDGWEDHTPAEFDAICSKLTPEEQKAVRWLQKEAGRFDRLYKASKKLKAYRTPIQRFLLSGGY